ncbi:hypothetical protein GCM10010199_61050 [Dactylosporangium roseum]
MFVDGAARQAVHAMGQPDEVSCLGQPCHGLGGDSDQAPLTRGDQSPLVDREFSKLKLFGHNLSSWMLQKLHLVFQTNL